MSKILESIFEKNDLEDIICNLAIMLDDHEVLLKNKGIYDTFARLHDKLSADLMDLEEQGVR